MKRVVVLFTACLCINLLFAQSSYREALNDYLQKSNSDIGKSEQLLPVLEQTLGDSLADVFVEYMQTQMIVDIADMSEDIFKKYLTEDELKNLAEWSDQERTKQIQQRTLESVTQFSDPNYLSVKMQPFISALSSVMKGETPEALPENNMSQSYEDKLQIYLNNNHINEMFDNVLNTIMQQTNGLITDPTTRTSFAQYARTFMDRLVEDMFVQIITEEDLEYFNDHAQTAEAQHLAQAQAALMSDPIEYANQYYSKVLKWIDKNHPEAKEAYERVFNINK